jgi:hypothetical protein
LREEARKEASYNVALEIAKEKWPETLVKPCHGNGRTDVCGEDAKLKIAQIPLSKDTIHNLRNEGLWHSFPFIPTVGSPCFQFLPPRGAVVCFLL